MQAKLAVLILSVALLSPCIMAVRAYSSGEFDKTAVAGWIIDGDTFSATSGEIIRLADIDTPEYGETGYSEAKNFLIDLIRGKTVYMDIDDISRTDSGGERLVCVVYIEYNSTHYENVNKALLVEDYAVLFDHSNNEFTPSTWVRYIEKTAIPEFPSILFLPLLITVVAFSALLYKKFNRASF